ncbi:MAG TPA: hypothetical protein IAC26_08155 [Candidatus Scatomorpha stercoravium]|nr:hypothetical protein [Candidatus Scatomorpha stercoravium]
MNYDEEIRRLRSEIARAGQLKIRLESLYRQRKELSEREAELRSRRVEEQDDVDRLEGRSLARYFYTLLGSLDEKLDAERAGARAAAVEHDAVLAELEDVNAAVSEAEGELARLSGCEERYDKAVSAKAEYLKKSGSPLADRLRGIEKRAAYNERQTRETDEAIRAGEAACAAAERVVKSLSSASTWSTIDIFSDSFLADVVKYGRIDDAQRAMEQLRIALRRFGTELADVGGRLETGMGDLLTFADIFFDNIFTDFAVSSRINRALYEAHEVEERVQRSLSSLHALRVRLETEAAELEKEYEGLVTSAQPELGARRR